MLRSENTTYNRDSWPLDSRNTVFRNTFPVSRDSFWRNAVDHLSSETGPITTNSKLCSVEQGIMPY